MTRFDDVTRQIKAQLEAGTRPWIKPWNGGGMPLPQRCNGEHYQGINIILLWMMGRTAPTWMTYNQAKQLGGQVRRGEKGTGICYTAPVTTKEDETYRVYKWYTVFNAEQIDGLPPQYYPQPVQDFVNTDKLIMPAEKLISDTGADIRHGEAKAYYVPAHDYINMPEFGEFRSALDYYSTMFHELVHWTGHKTRMDRKFSRNKTDYAIEELVAEMGSAFLMAHLGLEATVREDHASYLAHWLKALDNDSKFIFSAASAASQAVTHITAKHAAREAA